MGISRVLSMEPRDCVIGLKHQSIARHVLELWTDFPKWSVSIDYSCIYICLAKLIERTVRYSIPYVWHNVVVLKHVVGCM